MPNQCTEIHNSLSECYPELTENSTSTLAASVELVTKNPKNLATTSHSNVGKTNISLKMNATIISCGRQMLDNNKIVGGSETLKFGEFPWMAVVFYSKYNQNECAGSDSDKIYPVSCSLFG